jgi:hypothetical protein
MNAGYRITFDHETQKFDSQYPIFLVDKQVTPQEFAQTINAASASYADTLNTMKSRNKRATFAMVLGIMVMTVGIVFLSMTGVFVRSSFPLPLYLVLSIVATIAGTLAFTIAIVKMTKNQKQCRVDARNNLTNFMENENNTKYLRRGVQFLVKSDTFNFGQDQDAKHAIYTQPHIVILFCDNVAAIAQMMQPQPVMMQQPMYHEMQYMPQQVAPQIYSNNAEVAIPIYQQQYIQPQQPILYQSTQSVNQDNQKLL